MSWIEIKQKAKPGNHFVKVADLTKDKRLREIEQEDVDQLFSIHLTGRKVLWWDPERLVILSRSLPSTSAVD